MGTKGTLSQQKGGSASASYDSNQLDKLLANPAFDGLDKLALRRRALESVERLEQLKIYAQLSKDEIRLLRYLNANQGAIAGRLVRFDLDALDTGQLNSLRRLNGSGYLGLVFEEGKGSQLYVTLNKRAAIAADAVRSVNKALRIIPERAEFISAEDFRMARPNPYLYPMIKHLIERATDNKISKAEMELLHVVESYGDIFEEGGAGPMVFLQNTHARRHVHIKSKWTTPQELIILQRAKLSEYPRETLESLITKNLIRSVPIQYYIKSTPVRDVVLVRSDTEETPEPQSMGLMLVGRSGEGKTFSTLATLANFKVRVFYASFKSKVMKQFNFKAAAKDKGEEGNQRVSFTVLDDLDYLDMDVGSGGKTKEEAISHLKELLAKGDYVIVISNKTLEELEHIGSEVKEILSRLDVLSAAEGSWAPTFSPLFYSNFNAVIEFTAQKFIRYLSPQPRFFVKAISFVDGELTMRKLEEKLGDDVNIVANWIKDPWFPQRNTLRKATLRMYRAINAPTLIEDVRIRAE